LDKPDEQPRTFLDLQPALARSLLADALPGAFLDPLAADRLMSAYNLPTAPVKLATTDAEAALIATGLGFPVALKIASPDIPHKSDVGGVYLNAKDADEVRLGFRTVIENAGRAQPAARIDGVQVQRMLPDGQEVILGVKRDPQFGPLLMFGSGGVEVEGLKDVAFALAPLLPSDGEWLLQQTWAGCKLDGFRSILPADKAALLDVLGRLSQLAFDLPEIAEIEINPLRLLAPGQGAVALDVRVKLA
jgi:succinyl-CoA synthetase beta subunit